MIRNAKKNGMPRFSTNQLHRLDGVRTRNPTRYLYLMKYFDAMNAEKRRARVLNMKGEVIDEGFLIPNLKKSVK